MLGSNIDSNYWSRLKDSAAAMNDMQIQYVLSQESVRRVYEEMMGSFNSFLFEKFKNDFAAIPAFQPVVDRYITTVLQTAQDYGQRVTSLEEENAMLKQQVEGMRNVSRCTSEGA